MKVTGERRLSHDLNQGGMEIPATYIYRSTDMDMHSKLLILVGEATEGYNKANNKTKNELNTKRRRRKTFQENRNFF